MQIYYQGYFQTSSPVLNGKSKTGVSDTDNPNCQIPLWLSFPFFYLKFVPIRVPDAADDSCNIRYKVWCSHVNNRCASVFSLICADAFLCAPADHPARKHCLYRYNIPIPAQVAPIGQSMQSVDRYFSLPKHKCPPEIQTVFLSSICLCRLIPEIFVNQVHGFTWIKKQVLTASRRHSVLRTWHLALKSLIMFYYLSFYPQAI